MSNIKLIIMIFMNILFVSLTLFFGYYEYFLLICTIIGIVNYKYVYLNSELTNKQRLITQLFIAIPAILAIIYLFLSYYI